MRFNSAERLSSAGSASEINVAPLIDMVFILLIFFLVTTSFVRETGVQVEKPRAVTAADLERQSILISLSAEGRIYMGGEEHGLLSVRAAVHEELARRPAKLVVIIADGRSRHASLIDLVDECKLAGAKTISLAAERE